MGRLFWKFFFVLLLAQIASVLGVGLLISWHNREYASDMHRERLEALPRSAESSPEYLPPYASSPRPEGAESRPRGLRGLHGRTPRLPPPRRLILFPALTSGLVASLMLRGLRWPQVFRQAHSQSEPRLRSCRTG